MFPSMQLAPPQQEDAFEFLRDGPPRARPVASVVEDSAIWLSGRTWMSKVGVVATPHDVLFVAGPLHSRYWLLWTVTLLIIPCFLICIPLYILLTIYDVRMRNTAWRAFQAKDLPALRASMSKVSGSRALPYSKLQATIAGDRLSLKRGLMRLRMNLDWRDQAIDAAFLRRCQRSGR
jgi:hypothetical protein